MLNNVPRLSFARFVEQLKLTPYMKEAPDDVLYYTVHAHSFLVVL